MRDDPQAAAVVHIFGRLHLVRGAVPAPAGRFALGAGGNPASGSAPERRVMTPIALVLTAACLAVALDL